ncbi:MAG: T9SS type A sorting domain-containing protein [Flavobacteriales bacterium]|nr:T9SS type A sorting domain-containing protein [Flavobacteriales bacterium]
MMKKLLFTFATGAFLASGSVAQTNLNLENWTGNECDGWGSINSFMLIGAPQTLFQETTDPGEGVNSARIETAFWQGATNFGAPSDTVSGFLTLGGPPTSPMGVPYTDKPVSISFMYKSNLATGDTAAIFGQLSHWDNVLDSQMVDAQTLLFVAGVTTTWTPVTLPFAYFSTLNSDTLQIVCVSSKGTLFGTPLGIIGSELWVDDFMINLPVGIDEKDDNIKFSIFPNPTSDYVTITNGSSRSDIDVDLFDINGKLIQSFTDVKGGSATISRNGMAKGVYMVRVTSGGKQVIRQIIFE